MRRLAAALILAAAAAPMDAYAQNSKPLNSETTSTSEFVTRCRADAPGCAYALAYTYDQDFAARKNSCPPSEDDVSADVRDKAVLDWLATQKPLSATPFGKTLPMAYAALWPCK